MTTEITCPINGCDYSTGNVSEAVAIALLTTHAISHSAPPQPVVNVPAPVRGPKLDRPKVDVGISMEEWNMFERHWNVFKSGSGINDVSAAPQLFQCTSTTLGDALLKMDPEITNKILADVLQSMKTLAVIPVATGVVRSELLEMKQQRDEAYRAFSARVRGKAETCGYVTSSRCQCGQSNSVDYTEHIMRDVLVAGIYDAEIRRDILGIESILDKSINDVVGLVEKREMARDAHPLTASTSAVSSFKKDIRKPQHFVNQPSVVDRNRRIPCPQCGKQFAQFTESSAGSGWNSRPHELCIDCYRITRRQQRRQPRPTKTPVVASLNDYDSTGVISQIAVISADVSKTSTNLRVHDDHHSDTSAASVSSHGIPLKMSHHIFSSGEWRRAKFMDHPTIDLTMTLARKDYKAFSFRRPKNFHPFTFKAKLDSCAQSCLWSLKDCMQAGFQKEDLIPVSLKLNAANKSSIEIVGAVIARLHGTLPDGKEISCATMIYVSPSAEGFFLSLEAMLDMGLLSSGSLLFANDIHSIESGDGHGHGISIQSKPQASNRVLNAGCSTSQSDPDSGCSCPSRTIVPPRPDSLPFSASPENNVRMKEWLLHTFASSTFNTCPHRPLPCMSGPPIKIHVEESAQPKACHTPASIPIHWQDQVREDLLRDESLGVIEKVPYGEPVTWCHQMVITRKHDGSPRRTVDLSPLNKYCKRETFASESPVQMARRIPKDTWKTVTDAWNGFHGMPLHASDRHLTTFITPFGRWRYLRAPQGFVSSGDGYNRRFDAVLSEFLRKERCVDDVCHYDIDIQEHWWRTIDLLICIGKAGIVLNPDKFQFAERVIEFAGFRISDDCIEPLPKYLDAIREFPTPKNITDIRSWFGLVNQVSSYAQLQDLMAPFRPFLSPRCLFSWNPALDAAFQASKEAIVSAIREGVEIFHITKRTCLRPDWSQQGIRYFLLQKHCTCQSGMPDCCDDGWKLTLAGSRFLNSAEERYAPIEGEALAVAWGLEQSKYFTQGCDNLLVVTDHKPLVKILGDRTLDEISNTRLFRLKQRTLPWRFDIAHMPGKSNSAADATSRHPSPSTSAHAKTANINLFTDYDRVEVALNSAIARDAAAFTSISWHEIAKETAADPILSILMTRLKEGFPTDRRSLDDCLSSFWNLRHSLRIAEEDVVMYVDRVIIPLSLRPCVLMFSIQHTRALLVWKPGHILFFSGQVLIRTLSGFVRNVLPAARMHPQSATPAALPDIPSTPFESIFADFCEVAGRHYLVAGDRLSAWVEIFASPSGTGRAGSVGLIGHLRSLFSTFGVPVTLSSDGGPEFTASATAEFLKRWGVHHRISSAHFPQSNGRAEVAVKKAKRLLLTNVGPSGSLNNDRFLQAILQLRNTPEPDSRVSPAQIIFGRPLRDAFSFINHAVKFDNPSIHPMWREAWKAKEIALRTRFIKSVEHLNAHSRPLPPLSLGDRVFIQNQTGVHPTKWDRSGIIVESRKCDQYLVKVDGDILLTRLYFIFKVTITCEVELKVLPA